MDFHEVAKQLRESTAKGDLTTVKNILNPFTDAKGIKSIENSFQTQSDRPTDPVNFAIDCKQEKIAIFLVEKDFSIDQVYKWPKETCDQWCANEHGPGRCPATEYDAARNAEVKHLNNLKNIINDIKHKKRRAGDGLSYPVIEKHMPHPPPVEAPKPPVEQLPSTVVKKDKKTKADEARETVKKYGKLYTSKAGGTLLHVYIDKGPVYVYVFANSGVPVNVQDEHGDTALHLAARKKRTDVVEALVQCSADLSLRNKMGQTAVEEAEGTMKEFLKKFKQGVVVAVRDHKNKVLLSLLRLSWSSLHTKVKEGKSLLEWTEEKARTVEEAKASLRILTEFKRNSELIHAVLCEDVDGARRVITEGKGPFTVNQRFKDRKGKTLLSHAIEANNLELVQLLLANGANWRLLRVKEREDSDVTVPLFHKALRPDLNTDIAKYLQRFHTDALELEEKDINGNTPLLRAIEDGADLKMIQWLMELDGGRPLIARNKDGLTAIELAIKKERNDVKEAIQRFCRDNPQLQTELAVNFVWMPEEEDREEQQQMSESAEKEEVKMQEHAKELFSAAANGMVDQIKELCNAPYRDKNGYTALTRAIVFNQVAVVQKLCIYWPYLKHVPDNCNRYALHYAYALPESQGMTFVRLLTEKDPQDIENRVDKDGRVPADYKDLRNSREILQMLYDARTLNEMGQRGGPMGRWPPHAETQAPGT